MIFCLILGARCIAIGLYVMLEVHKSHRVLFLKPDGLENFGHTANDNKTYIFAQQILSAIHQGLY